MSHLAMLSIGAHGHVNPSLPVLAELVRRGHRVSVAVPAPFAAAVASTGATPVGYDSTLPDEERGERWPEDGVEAVTMFFDEARHVVEQLADAFDDDRPDLWLADIAGYAARVLAWRWDLPLVQLSPAIVAWDGYEEDMAEALAPMLEDPAHRAYQDRFAAWLDVQGVPLAPLDFVGRPPRSVVLVPRALQPHADRVDPDVYSFVGPCLDARSHQGDWPAPDRPLVVVSLGSAYTDDPPFFRACAEAFTGRGWRVVLAVGRHLDLDDLGPLPSDVEAHRWVPQLAVLRHASLFVTHAGMGGCSEGLHEGVPMIAVPQAVDQFGNAEMLAAAGVGVVVAKEEASADALGAAADALLGSPEVAARCAAEADELRRAGGASRAADLVEAAIPRH